MNSKQLFIRLKYQYLSIITFSFLIIFNTSYAQNLSSLEKQKRNKQKEIEYTNQLIKQTKKNKKNSYNQLVLLNKQINSRKELISNIEYEVNSIDSKISNNDKNIIALEAKLKALKDEYAKLIYFAYKNHSPYNKLLYIFSAKDFNSAYKRIKYLQQYTQYRQKQAKLIISTRDSIAYLISDLHQKKSQKIELVNDHKNQTIILSNEKQAKTNVLSSLKLKEKELKKKLVEQQIEAQKMQRAIEAIIEEEARKAAERAKIEAELKAKENELKKNKTKKNITSKSNDNEKDNINKSTIKDNKTISKNITYSLTSEDQLISDNFGKNQGKLPWPTERGVITGTYGEHEHPVLKGVKTMNNGITITTSDGSKARVIYDGIVSKVISIPGSNNVVIIRHGDYLSVYKNLTTVFVNSGDKVKAKQTIGTIFTDEDGKTSVDLQIWKGNTKLNPALWLSH